MYYRLIKPSWGKKSVKVKGEWQPNPDFVREIKGPNIHEGCFDSDYIKAKNEEGYNIYWFPNHPKVSPFSEEKKFLNGRDIDVFEYVYVDMDLKDKIYDSKKAFLNELETFPLKPTLTVDSGHGIHAYWRVQDLTRETHLILQQSLIKRLKTDTSIWSVLQLMRLPGTLNTKVADEYKPVVTIDASSSGAAYKLSDFPPEMFVLDPEQKKKVQYHIDKLDGRVEMEFAENINLDELPEEFVHLLYNNERIWELFKEPKKAKGDRSSADMTLANLLYNRDFSKADILTVIANTEKALTKGTNRFDYASHTVEKLFATRIENKFLSVGERLKSGVPIVSGEPVHGPPFLDVLEYKWCKKQVMGLIAGSGMGKTTVSLTIFKHMIENNKDNNDIFIFFSLEMPEEDIIEKWIALVGRDSPLANRLYVIGNEDDKGEPRQIGLQEVVWYCKDIQRMTQKNIGAVAIDHVHILHNMVDISKQPTFGAEGSLAGGRGKQRILDVQTICKQMKPIAKMLNTFLLVLTQTTKDKGKGDTPIDKDGAYGVSQYEWMMDYIITLWQPLMRVQDETDMRVLAWQYAKVRKKHKNDRVQTYTQNLLRYDMDTGDLRPMNGQEMTEFYPLEEKAKEARKKADNKEGNKYVNSPCIADLKKLMGEENEVPKVQQN